jgi:hypothetical protein
MPRRFGQGGDEGLGGKGAIQAHLEQPDLLALGGEVIDALFGGFGTAAHHHDDPLRIGRAEVVEQVVLPAGQLGEAVHHLLNDGGSGIVVAVARLAGLEKHVRVLRRTAQHRAIRRQRPAAMGDHVLIIDHSADVRVGHLDDLGHFVRGAEPVEKVQERQARFERGCVGDGRVVHRLLHRTGSEQRESGGPGGHHVAVITEDAQRVRRDRAGADVEDHRGQLAGHLEHIGNHQEQALRRGEGGGQRPGLHGSVNRAGRAPFALQFADHRDGAPDVLQPGGAPRIGHLSHARTGRDGIDGDDLAGAVGDRGGGFVSVDGDLTSLIHRASSRRREGLVRLVCGPRSHVCGGRALRLHPHSPKQAACRELLGGHAVQKWTARRVKTGKIGSDSRTISPGHRGLALT